MRRCVCLWVIRQQAPLSALIPPSLLRRLSKGGIIQQRDVQRGGGTRVYSGPLSLSREALLRPIFKLPLSAHVASLTAYPNKGLSWPNAFLLWDKSTPTPTHHRCCWTVTQVMVGGRAPGLRNYMFRSQCACLHVLVYDTAPWLRQAAWQW